ncbi:MAG: late competence development ComFB family protein [Spirochaetales bacterium]
MSMEIHNLMEDVVVNLIHSICDEEETAKEFGYCTSPECRVDAVCYVLNRTQPRYVSSARGMSHTAYEQERDTQAHIDLVALAHEALRRISSFRRSYYTDSESYQSVDAPDDTDTALPIITGRLLDADTFRPVTDVSVALLYEGTVIPMIDRRWDNPYEVTGNASGRYSFWPKTPSKEKGTSEFEFSIAVDDSRFEPFRHYFRVPVIDERPSRSAAGLIRHFEHVIPDLYLVPDKPDENDERG